MDVPGEGHVVAADAFTPCTDGRLALCVEGCGTGAGAGSSARACPVPGEALSLHLPGIALEVLPLMRHVRDN